MQHHLEKTSKCLLFTAVIICFNYVLAAQPVPAKTIFFPASSAKKWSWSVGLSAITPPYAITEEFHFRIPAVDLRLNREVTEHLQLKSNFTLQVLQNELVVGLYYHSNTSSKIFFGLGNDIGYWLGHLHFSGFNSKGHGWEDRPNFALGYKVGSDISITLKGEALFNFGVRTYAGKSRVAIDYRILSGSAATLMVEQPFFKTAALALGFRAMYTDFFWQTWPAFESFNRNLFYHQIIIAVIP